MGLTSCEIVGRDRAVNWRDAAISFVLDLVTWVDLHIRTDVGQTLSVPTYGVFDMKNC